MANVKSVLVHYLVYLFLYLFICLPPCMPVCLPVHPISQQPIRPSDHVLALPTCLCFLPAWAVFRSFSCHAVCLPLHLFIRFFFPFCFERNSNSSVSIVIRLSAGRVRICSLNPGRIFSVFSLKNP